MEMKEKSASQGEDWDSVLTVFYLDDKVLNRELEVALWRTGRGSDGGRKMEFKFTGDEKRASDGTVNNILTSRTLQDMLRVTILKNKTAWQFS